jgi:DNA-binding NarL/FixJ family response regulator
MSVPLCTRIVLADDHTIVRHGLRLVLDAAPDLKVVAEAHDGIEAVERGLREDIDLAVLDVAMPRRTGLDAARELVRRRRDVRVLMLSMHDLEEYCFQALKVGASGYVLKTGADRDLVEACRAAMRGESFLYPPTIRALMRAYLEDPERTDENRLTPREIEVVKLVSEAHTSEQIAELLVISPKTVERHRETQRPRALACCLHSTEPVRCRRIRPTAPGGVIDDGHRPAWPGARPLARLWLAPWPRDLLD